MTSVAKQKKNQLRQDVQTLRGLRRADHFANGGDLTMWRGGKAITIPNRKREASRKACRRIQLD